MEEKTQKLDYQPLDIEVQQNVDPSNLQNEEGQNRGEENQDTFEGNNIDEAKLIESNSRGGLKKCVDSLWSDLNKKQRKWAVLSISLLILVWIFHSLMEEQCPYKTDHDCLNSFILPKIKLWGFFILFNCFSILLQVHMLVEKKTNRWFPITSLTAASWLLIFGDQTITLNEYIGGINAIHIIWLFLLIQMYGVVKMWSICFRKNKKLCLLLNFVFISGSALLIYLLFVRNGCNQWSKGINGQIDNESNPEMCKIKEPEYCWYTVVDGFQDLSRLIRSTCDKFPQKDKGATEIFERYFGSSVGDERYVGFASLKEESELNRMDQNIQKTVFAKAKGYGNLTLANKAGHEVIFDRKERDYIINLKKNLTLTQERSEKMKNSSSSNPLVTNVLLIFIDAISRQSIHLKLPKTVSWFQKRTQQQSSQNTNSSFSEKSANQANNFTQLNGQESTQTAGQSYEFYRFNSLKPYTYDNLEMVLYGNIPQRKRDPQKTNQQKSKEEHEDTTEINSQKGNGIVEDFKARGFITGHAGDICQTLSLEFDEETAETQNSLRYDHETFSFQCNPNYQNPESPFNMFQGPYSILNRCVYGQPIADLTLSYAKSFLTEYKNESKFMHLEYQYGHEGTGEVVRYLDEPLSEFLESMSSTGELDDTAVILMSDHGLHMHGLFYFMNLENVHTEVNLPGLFIYLPPNINSEFQTIIEQNQQNLVSAKNIRHFLMHLIIGKEYQNKTLSLLSPLQQQTNCNMLDIGSNECSCF